MKGIGIKSPGARLPFSRYPRQWLNGKRVPGFSVEPGGSLAETKMYQELELIGSNSIGLFLQVKTSLILLWYLGYACQY